MSRSGVWLESALTAGPTITERYAALTEQIPAILYVDLPDEDDTTLYVSPQIEPILGVDPDFYVNAESNPWADNLHPAQRDETVAEYQRLLASGGGVHEYCMIRPDNGDEVWIQDSFTVLGDGANQIVQGVMVDVTRRKRDEGLIAEQLRMLERAEQIGKTFTTMVVNRGDITHVLEVLGDLVGNPVVLVDNSGQISALADAGLGSESVYQRWEAHARVTHVPDETAEVVYQHPSADLSTQTCLWQDVTIRDDTWGRLHVLQVLRELDQIDVLAVDRAVAALGVALLVERESGHLTESARASLIVDLASDRVGSGMEFQRRSRSLGIDLGRDNVAVVVMEPSGLEPHTERNRHLARTALLRRCRAALAAAGWRALSALEGDRVVAVVAVPKGTDFRAALAAVADPSYSMGASDVVSFARVSRAYQQATEAATHAQQLGEGDYDLDDPTSGVVHFEDLGLTHLLSALADGPDLARFVEVELGPLLAHDRSNGALLIPTLRAFLSEHGAKTAAAKRLHIERRTVYYRLERITVLLSRDLDDRETRLRLEVALRGLDLLNARDPVVR